MELRQLRHFLALAEEMHFGRAAQRACITQSALSASISRLEEEFGIRLFERDSKTVRITQSGEMMLNYARSMLNEAERTSQFARALSDGKVGRISLGFSCAVLTPTLDALIQRCRSECPEVEIVLLEHASQRQFELLRSGKLDAGLLGTAAAPADLDHVLLSEEKLMVCLPAAHPLAGQPSVDLYELHKDDFVILARDRAPGFHDMFLGLCATAGFIPRVACEAEHTFSTLKMVERGWGVGLVMESVAFAGGPGVTLVPLTEPSPRWCTYLAWTPSRYAPGLGHLIDRFTQFARQGPLD